MNLPTSNKDVASEARVLRGLGWEFSRTGGDGHHVFVHRDHGTLRLPGSPSNPRWIPAFRQRLAAAMGMTKPDLERLLGERAPKGAGAPTRRRVRQSKIKRPVDYTPPATAEAPPVPRIAELERGTPEFRREYMQLEADGLSPTEIRRLIARYGEAA